MYIEIILIGAIIFFILIYLSVANRYAMYERNLLDELNALKQGTKLCNILDFIKSSNFKLLKVIWLAD